jgi:hypothetical protein
MRFTIIKNDNMVYINGIGKEIDCSELPEDFHALQWLGETGWIEFKDNYKVAEPIEDISNYQKYIDNWFSLET